jgi:hypothetical protein
VHIISVFITSNFNHLISFIGLRAPKAPISTVLISPAMSSAAPNSRYFKGAFSRRANTHKRFPYGNYNRDYFILLGYARHLYVAN